MNLELGLTVQHMTIKNTVSFVLVQMITTSGKAIFKNFWDAVLHCLKGRRSLKKNKTALPDIIIICTSYSKQEYKSLFKARICIKPMFKGIAFFYG